MITREEAFSERKSNVSYFRIFGGFIYCNISKQYKKKLELAAELVVFVFDRQTPHNYSVYLPSLRMIAVGRDVKFNEDKLMQCSLERELQIPLEEDILASKEEP